MSMPIGVFDPNNFPLTLLPRRLRQAVLALHFKVKAPVPICVISILSAASIACSAGHRVKRFNGFVSNLALFLLAIAESGERKTTCDTLATRALAEVDKMLREAFKKESIAFKAEHTTWKTLCRGVSDALRREAASGRDTQDLKEKLATLIASEPVKPISPSILVNDITPEAIIEHLANNAFTGLFSNEAGAIFSGRTMSNLGMLNIAWDGGSIRVDRKVKPPLIVDDATLTMSLMVQFEVLQSFLKTKGEQARSNGLLARFLLCHPFSTQGQRFEVLNDKDYSDELDEFQTWTKNLLLKVIDESVHVKNEKKQLEFNPAAKELCRNYHNLIEQNLQPIGQFTDIRDAAAKIGDNMARLAGVFHLASNDEGDISYETTEAAIAVSDYFLCEFKRLFGQVPQVPAWQADAMKLLSCIQQTAMRINSYQLRKNLIRQCAPHSLRNKTLFDSALLTLVSAGYIQIFKHNKTTYLHVVALPLSMPLPGTMLG